MAGARAVSTSLYKFTAAEPRTLAAIAVATMIAGAAAVVGGEASAPDARSAFAAQPATFSERFALGPVGSDCSSKGWPYFAAECLREPNGSRARPARIIVIDRQTPN
ncbi:MAG: hypothetical protein GEU91_19755 [Rhizobiales bacterium]|nr:hypothetical protein [Hyphomicrobiales bacterium]